MSLINPNKITVKEFILIGVPIIIITSLTLKTIFYFALIIFLFNWRLFINYKYIILLKIAISLFKNIVNKSHYERISPLYLS